MTAAMIRRPLKTKKTLEKLKNQSFKGKGSTLRIDPKLKKKQTDSKKGQTRGREISIREAAAVRNTVYGRMRLGGVITFMDAGGVQESKAHLTTGSDNYSIGWVARDAGSEGNNITVTIVVPGSNATLTVGVVGTAITVTARSSGGVSQSTANQVIAAIQANVSANALVSVNKGGQKGTANVQAVTTTNLTGGGGTWLHTVHTLAGHQIDAVEKVFINNIEFQPGASPDPRWGIGFFQNLAFVTHNLGEWDQEAIPDLVGQLPTKWTASDRQRSCAHTYTINIYQENVYPSGEPDYAFLIRGKLLYDPRTAQTVWSNNAALVILDYLITSKGFGGCGVDISKIDLTNFSQAADTCDEAIPIQPSGTEPKYTINIDFEWDRNPREILEIFAQSIAGPIIRYNGKWRCFPGKWRTPVMTLTEDDVRGPISISTRNQKRDLYNRARGTFLDPNQAYEQVDLPAVKNATYLAQDVDENWLDVDFVAITSPGQGQRILKFLIEKSRQGISLSFPASLRTYKLHPEDVIELILERYGWESMYFLVSDLDFQVTGQANEWKIEPILYLEETAEGLHDWDVSEETVIDPAPDTNLPDPLTAIAPSNVTLSSGTTELFIRSDGTVFSRLKVSWDMSLSPYILFGGKYELQFKKSADSSWSHTETILGDSNFHHILNVQDGVSYDVRIRSVNALNFPSSWITVTGHTVVGKTAPPSNVASLSTALQGFGTQIFWPHITDIDRDEYEIRVGASWAGGDTIYRGKGNVFNWEYRVAGTYTLRIKAYDTTHNESASDTTHTITIEAPDAPVVSSVLEGANVILSWTQPAADFAVKEYEVRYGASYGAGVVVQVITGLSISIPVTWGGARTFHVACRDIAGNTGASDSEVVTIDNPNPIENFNPRVDVATVLLDWTPPQPGDLPIAKYYVYKGDTFASSILIGTVSDTFNAYVETAGGTFNYWIVSEDTAGNLSTEVGGSATVGEPQGYFVTADYNPDNALAQSQNVVFGGRMPSIYTDATLTTLPGFSASKLVLDAALGVTIDSNLGCSQINDQVNSNHFTQSTSANRPKLTGYDNTENRSLYSEDFNTGHAKIYSTVSVNQIANPIDGEITADKILDTTDNQQHYVNTSPVAAAIFAGERIVFSVYAKAAELGFIIFQRAGTAFSGTRYSWVNLNTGAVTSSVGAAPTVTSVGNGWYKIEMIDTATANGIGHFTFTVVPSSGTINYAGTGAQGVYVYGAVIRDVRSDSTYRKTEGTVKLRGLTYTAENLFLKSEDITAAQWTKTRTTALSNQIANPVSDIITADLLKEDSSSSTTHPLLPTTGHTLIPNTKYRVSAYVKKKERHISIRFDNAWTGNPYAHFDLDNGTVHSVGSGVTASCHAVAGHTGWYRIIAECTTSASPGTAYPSFYMASVPGTVSYTGDNSSGVYIFGMQFHRSISDPEYMPSDTTPFVGAAYGNFALSFDGSNDSLVSTYTPLINAGFSAMIVCSPNVIANQAMISSYNSGNTRLQFYLGSGGTVECYAHSGVSTYVGRTAPAGSYVPDEVAIFTCVYDGGVSATGIKIYKNGVQIDTTTVTNGSYTTPATPGDPFEIGSRSAGSGIRFSGKISFVRFCESTLTASELSYWHNYLARRFLENGNRFDGESNELQIIAPVARLKMSLEQRLASYGWADLAAKDSAGYGDHLLLPSDINGGFVEWIKDHGAIFANSFINFSYDVQNLTGSGVEVIPQISTSLDGVTWTDFPSASQVFGTNFRYTKQRLTVYVDDDLSLCVIKKQRVVLSLQEVTETGQIAAVAGDVGGTTYTFQNAFVDVDHKSIKTSLIGNVAGFATHTFTDVSNPVSMQIYAWDPAGARMSATVNIELKGAKSPS